MNAANKLTIGLVQMAMAADPAVNAARAEELVAEAAKCGAKIVCLPELCLTPYFCQTESADRFDLAEAIPGPSSERFARLARRLAVAIVLPLFERRAKGVYHNSAVVLDAAGQIAGHYRKMHIPDDPGYYEKYYFTPGDTGAVVANLGGVRLGVLICWDQWFPEAARLTALAGADVIVYPTAIGWHPAEKAALGTQQRDAWITSQRAHAIANGVFVAAVNRVLHERPTGGSGDGIEFWGSSFVCGPMGQVLDTAPDDCEELLVVELDSDLIESTRRGWPFLRDRRIDAYDGLLRRWGGE